MSDGSTKWEGGGERLGLRVLDLQSTQWCAESLRTFDQFSVTATGP